MAHNPIETVLWGEELTPQNALFKFSALGTVQDIVTVDGAPAQESYRVRLYRVDNGAYISETWSTPGTGVYSFHHVATETDYVPVTVDHNNVFKAVAAGPITPTPTN